MLENFGLRVISERPYELAWPDGGAAWIQDFELEHRDGCSVDIARVGGRLPARPSRASGAATLENDGFNRLVLGAGLERARRSWCCAPTAATCCRPACLQPGVHGAHARGAIPPSPRNLVRLFEARFDPAGAGRARRAQRRRSIVAQIRARPRRGHQPRRRPHPARLPRRWCRPRCAPTSSRTDADGAAQEPTSPSSSTRRRSPICRCRGRCSRSSSTARGSRACTCAWATSRAAASAGRTGARTSAPRSWA